LAKDDLEAEKRFRAGVFGRGARDYDRVGTRIFDGLGTRLAELAGIAEGDRVLDVATGRGAVLFAAAELVGDGGYVVGVDLAQEMVDLTQADIRIRGIENATVGRGDAERLDAFDDGEFDCVTCAFAIFFLPDADAALREFHRVLRPGGTVALSSWRGEEDPGYEWYRDLRRDFGISVSLETRPFDTADEIRAALSSVDFAEVRVSAERVLLRLSGPEEWWRWLNSIAGRATVESLDSDTRERFRKAAFERFDHRYEDGTVEFNEEALLAVAKKPTG
jgi:ubiquinone/menaquinone biosynthesis C-methylase UbiE